MKTAISVTLAVALVVMCGCRSSSPRGGGMTKDVGFTVTAPMYTTDIKQGQTGDVTVTVERGKYLKQDVKLVIEGSKGITVDPTKVMVKASDTPDVQVRITADKDAAMGEYRVTVKATPESGEPTSTVFNVKVVAP